MEHVNPFVYLNKQVCQGYDSDCYDDVEDYETLKDCMINNLGRASCFFCPLRNLYKPEELLDDDVAWQR